MNHLLQDSFLRNSEFQMKPLDCGIPKVRLKRKPLKEDIGGTLCPLSPKKMIGEASSMQECPLISSKVTLKDRLLHSKINIPTTKLYPTLDQELTSSEKAYKPFWNSSLKEEYQKLWLPIETDLVALDMTSSNSSLRPSMSNWRSLTMQRSQSMSSQKTSYRSLQFLPPVTMDPENTTYCRKLRIYPNREQLQLFRKCLGAYRYFYNKTNCFIKDCRLKREVVPLSRSKIRPMVLKSDSSLNENDPEKWQKDVPYDVRQEAINDCVVAWKTNLTKMKRKQIKSFNVKYKSKKDMSQIFRVNKNALNIESMRIFVTRLKNKAKLRFRKRDLKKYTEDGTLDRNFLVLFQKPDYWYVCLPKVRQSPIYENAAYKSVFLDPGVRTFQTFYSPEGICGKITVDDKIKALAAKHDMLQSLSSKASSRTKRHMKARMEKLRHKMKNIVNDLHWQTCHFLTTGFRTIVIPPFETSKMTQGSPLGSKVTRNMLTLSHGLFKDRLKYYCALKQRYLLITSEAYTTKTCGCCGHLQEMQGAKVYHCSQCEMILDRDLNGARNLALRTLS